MFTSKEKLKLALIKNLDYYTPYMVAKYMGLKFGDKRWAPAMNYVFGGSSTL